MKGQPLTDFNSYSITKDEAEDLLQRDLVDVIKSIKSSNFYADYLKLSIARRIIIESMVYQMGADGVSKFKNMWAAIRQEDFVEASAEMLDSLWAKQTLGRATRHAKVMKHDDLELIYGDSHGT